MIFLILTGMGCIDSDDEKQVVIETECTEENLGTMASTKNDGLNDYDQDGDGYVSNEHAEISGLLGGDCDDEDALVHPEVTEIGTMASTKTVRETTISIKMEMDMYHQHIPIDTLPTDDCDDENFDINPSVTEIWYDGVDQNCDGLNDYDQDGDGISLIEGEEVIVMMKTVLYLLWSMRFGMMVLTKIATNSMIMIKTEMVTFWMNM